MAKKDNHNEVLTALTNRRVPILMAATSSTREGEISFKPWHVRRVDRDDQLISILRDPSNRERLEKLHGRIDDGRLKRLREMLGLADRLAAGDWSPIYKQTTTRRVAKREDGTTEVTLSSRSSVSSAPFALIKEMTAGMTRSRYVVWLSDKTRRFAPGLFCEDVTTALYAATLSAIGQPGGIGVCPNCQQAFPRTRAKQKYCTYKCQTAAGMKRYRERLEQPTMTKSKSKKSRRK